MKKSSLFGAVLTLSATSLFTQAVTAAETEIQEVLVSASLVPIAAKRSANAITVIDREQLSNRAALSVSDLLRDVPGLAVSRSGVCRVRRPKFAPVAPKLTTYWFLSTALKPMIPLREMSLIGALCLQTISSVSK